MLSDDDAKAFLEGMFYLIKMVRQTSDDCLVMCGLRIATAKYKANTNVLESGCMTQFDGALDIANMSMASPVLKRFYLLMSKAQDDIRCGTYCIDIEAYYQAFNQFLSGKTSGGKGKIPWNSMFVGFSRSNKGDTHFTRFYVIHTTTQMFETTTQPVAWHTPRRLSQYYSYRELKTVYAPSYRYVSHIILENSMVQELLAMSDPVELELGKECFLCNRPLRAFETSNLPEGFIMLSKSMFIKEVAKCSEVACLIYRHTTLNNRYMLRLESYYDTMAFGLDVPVFIVPRSISI